MSQTHVFLIRAVKLYAFFNDPLSWSQFWTANGALNPFSAPTLTFQTGRRNILVTATKLKITNRSILKVTNSINESVTVSFIYKLELLVLDSRQNDFSNSKDYRPVRTVSN